MRRWLRAMDKVADGDGADTAWMLGEARLCSTGAVCTPSRCFFFWPFLDCAEHCGSAGTHAHTHTHTLTYTHTFARTHQTRAYTRIHTHTRMHNRHTPVTRTRAHTHHIRAYTHTHTHTHTHIHSQTCWRGTSARLMSAHPIRAYAHAHTHQTRAYTHQIRAYTHIRTPPGHTHTYAHIRTPRDLLKRREHEADEHLNFAAEHLLRLGQHPYIHT